MRGTVTLLGDHSFPCNAPALQPTEAASFTRRVTVGRSRRRAAPRWPYLCSGSRPASQGRRAGSARRTEPRVQGSERQLVLILPPSFPRLRAVPRAALGPGPLGPSWGSTSAAARPTGRRHHRPRAALGPRLRQARLLQGRARCAQPTGGGRRLPGPQAPRSPPQARPAPPVPGGGVGAGRDSFSSPQRRRRTAWRRRRRRRRRRWRRRRRRGRKAEAPGEAEGRRRRRSAARSPVLVPAGPRRWSRPPRRPPARAPRRPSGAPARWASSCRRPSARCSSPAGRSSPTRSPSSTRSGPSPSRRASARCGRRR